MTNKPNILEIGPHFCTLHVYVFLNFHVCIYIFLKIIYLLIFDCAGFSLLHRLFPSCSEWGYSLVAMPRLLIVVASLVVEHRL